jgi:Oxidoreductase molybdopterin binding domain
VSGTACRLGAVGMARWRGVRLSTVLRRAGLTRRPIDVLPAGLDPHYAAGGLDLGPVRRPLPVWVGEIEVSGHPLVSPWNTQFYRYFGPGFPPEGSPPLSRQVVKSAFELPSRRRSRPAAVRELLMSVPSPPCGPAWWRSAGRALPDRGAHSGPALRGGAGSAGRRRP